MIIAVTGTPGTGKTTLGRLLAKRLHADYLDVGAFIKRKKLISGYDKVLQASVVDVAKVVKALVPLLKTYRKEKKDLIIDSHLSHYLPSRYVDCCFVTTCDLKVLQRRLRKRHYSARKIRENMNAEIFSVCLLEATVNKHNMKIVDTSKRLKVNTILRLL